MMSHKAKLAAKNTWKTFHILTWPQYVSFLSFDSNFTHFSKFLEPYFPQFSWVLNFSYQKSYKTCSCLVQVEWDTFDSPFTLDVGNQWKRKLGLLHSVWKYRKKVSFFKFSNYFLFFSFNFRLFEFLNRKWKMRHFFGISPTVGLLAWGFVHV